MTETLQNTASRLATFIAQNYTDVETGPGSVINELLIKLAAAVQNEQYNKIATLSQGGSISSVLSSSADSYSPVMDLIASNYNTERSTGTIVRGKLKITVSADNEYNLRAGLKFTQPALNLEYSLVSDTRVSSNPSTVLQEVQLYTDQGMYYFIVDVVASTEGPQYQVSSGTVFAMPPKATIAGFVKAEAYGNFSSGKAKETDKELVAKIKNNLGSTRFESAAGLYNNFSKTFAGFQSLSVCGANDAEMMRCRRNALGISTFGKVDVYVRTSLGPMTSQLKKTAVKEADGVWRMFLSGEEIPGFYKIKSIIPIIPNVNLGGTLLPKDIVYGRMVYGDGQRNNEVTTKEDARFTKYQTADVLFYYNESPALAIGKSATFEVHASYQPNILEMQNMLLTDNRRLACADYLVKAVIPCDVSLEISLLKKRATDTFASLKLQQLKKDIFTYVNSIPFGGELHASNIVDICHNYDIKRVDLPIKMRGTIFCPDGTNIVLEDGDVLSIPNNLAKGVTPKTCMYFIDYYRVEEGSTNAIDNIGLNIA